jgi:hypothetical protein
MGIYNPLQLQASCHKALQQTEETTEGTSNDISDALSISYINRLVPHDTISYDKSTFTGTVYVIDVRSSHVKAISFDTPQTQALSPFIYSKPIIKDLGNPYDYHDISLKKTLR